MHVVFKFSNLIQFISVQYSSLAQSRW